jgi:ribonuclease HI
MKLYAVKKGRGAPALFNNWDQCQQAVHSFAGAQYKSFVDLASASTYLQIDPQTAQQLLDQPIKLEACIKARKQLSVYTDGSCAFPGSAQAIAGAGVYFPDLNLRMSIPVPGAQTNNRGELWAVIQAMEYVSHLPDNPVLLIHADSKYVINGISNKRYENLDIWEYFDKLLKIVEVDWIKVKAHIGVEANEIAGKLAGELTKYRT